MTAPGLRSALPFRDGEGGHESPYNFGSSTYSKCYMRMSGSDTSQQPYLQVVYNGGDAVG